MSWVDNLITEFTISTGDDKVYTPLSLYMTWNRSLQFNIAEFNFKNVAGTLVKRGAPRGMQYNIEIVFQGDDNLTLAAQFLKSAANPAPWTITHPFYGQLYVQPSSLAQDNGKLNQSIISGQVTETLQDADVQVSSSIPDAITAAANTVTTNYTKRLTGSLKAPVKSSFLQTIGSNMLKVKNIILGKINAVQEAVNDVVNKYNTFNSALNRTIFSLEEVAAAATSLVVAPALFTETVLARIDMFSAQLDVFGADVDAIINSYADVYALLQRKLLYEHNAGVAITGICVSAVNNITTDYDYRPDVLSIIAGIIAEYNQYIENLYSLQTADGGQLTSYIPDATAVTSLSTLVKTTVSALFTISAGAKQERTLILPYDTNLILVANDLYGMQEDDSTVDTLRANNNIGADEIFVLKQGRKIIYYT